ncbi:MAG: hypothetical protein E6G56_09470 [Actinobacteria bacterium]|nr:MAG: hypothetical protein E6G56_09470 [Actinomycetota bacterium]
MAVSGLRLSTRTGALLAAFLAVATQSASAGPATITWGSDLSAAPDHALAAGVDTVYWSTRSAHVRVRAPRKGQVTMVTVRGSSVAGACARLRCSARYERTILFQDLRPARGGRLRVVATSQPFELPATDASYSFTPMNFFVKKGDYVGMAILGGAFKVFATVSGSSVGRFTGAGHDRNGARVHGGSLGHTELLLKVTERT